MAVESTPADHGVRQMYQRLVDVVSLLVAHPQAAEPLLPANRPLDHPAVAAQPHAALDSAPRDSWRNASLAQCDSQRSIVIRLVGMQLLRALAGAAALTAYWPDRVQRLKQLLAVMDVRPAERHRQRDAAAVYHLMAFRARFAAVRRARADGAPFFRGAPLARTLTESMNAGSAPIDLPGLLQLAQQQSVQLPPDACAVPVSQPAPAGHPAAAAHLSREHLPGQAASEEEEDAGERGAV